MIVLACTYCGNINLQPGRYIQTYRCECCEKDLALYEVIFKYFPDIQGVRYAYHHLPEPKAVPQHTG